MSKALSPDTEQTIKEGLNRMYDKAVEDAIAIVELKYPMAYEEANPVNILQQIISELNKLKSGNEVQ